MQKTSMSKEFVIGLIGNPNCGKTTIFNQLTGARQKVANWSGVTVEKREGFLKRNGYRIKIVDLPGIYSLSSFSIEEIITRNFILNDQPDVIINVVDAGNIERNLYLTTQLINIKARVVIALNMFDEAESKGIIIDTENLGTLLGMPVIKTIGTKGKGISELIDNIIGVAEQKSDKYRHIHIPYGEDIELEIKKIQNIIWNDKSISERYSTRWLAIRLLENDNDVKEKLRDYSNFNEIEQQSELSRITVEKKYNDNISNLLSDVRQGFISGALKETIKKETLNKIDFTEKIDSFVMNKYLGYPILIIFLWLLFQMTFTLGELPKLYIEKSILLLSSLLKNFISPGAFRGLLTEGIIGGVGSVIVFLPNILILFLGVSLMEDSGYMARAAFIMDKFMHRLGIHGKSFIPLIMGFGCNVPAIMATRMLENKRDRIITILINPFMSCSARLPVYVLFAGVFFNHMAGLVIITLYFLGVFFAFISARIFKFLFFKGESAPFVMELPPYRMPSAKTILLHMWNRSSQYLKKMGGIILIFSIVIWVMSEYPKSTEINERYNLMLTKLETQYTSQINSITSSHENNNDIRIQLSQEYTTKRQKLLDKKKDEVIQYTFIGRIGSIVEPVLRPLGFSWQMGVSLITGIAAKEVVVSTLGILYNASSGADASGEGDILERELLSSHHGITPLTAFTFMLFVLLYIPCVATIAAIGREIGWNWAFFSIAYNTILTWIVCFLTYNVGKIIGFS